MSLTSYPSLENLLEEARHRIEVKPFELDAAKARRFELAQILRQEFPGCRIYYNGSVAHGDALTPLVDVDLGIVVPDPEHRYGPGKRGPAELKERAAEALRAGLRPKYGELRIDVEGRKRSILVRFRDPLRSDWEDFTADVIVAVDNPTGHGLYIPRDETWDRSDPETHTELVLEAINTSEKTYARGVRLIKHWARQYDKSALCSWHIKALALGCLTAKTSNLEALQTWFEHAIAELTQGDTPDPARVGPSIKAPDNDRWTALKRLEKAQDQLREAVKLEEEGWHAMAHDALAKLFNDPTMLPRPTQVTVVAENASRLRAESGRTRRAATAATPVAAVPAVRSWAP